MRLNTTAAIAWFSLLSSLETLMAQTTFAPQQFALARTVAASGTPWNPFCGIPGTMTIDAGTVRFDAERPDQSEYSFEVRIADIAEIKREPGRPASVFLPVSIPEDFRIKLTKARAAQDKNYRLSVLNDRHKCGGSTEPVIAALSTAMSPPAPAPPLAQKEQPRRSFAPIPPPTVPANAPVPPPKVLIGQTPDEVKAILDEPSNILNGESASVVWLYKSLRITFVDGKVSIVEQTDGVLVR